MSRKKTVEAKPVEVKPGSHYIVEVLLPFSVGGLKLLPRHANVKLRGEVILANPNRVKVLGEVVKED